MHEQLIVLVNDQDEQIGTMPKMAVHHQGLLHRAFSIFLLNDEGKMLLQKRAADKYHSPSLWSNACCSHPLPNETLEIAAKRRLLDELNISVDLSKAFEFVYKVSFDNGLTEHEYDHIFLGKYNDKIKFNKSEVESIKYMLPKDILQDIKDNGKNYTEWFKIALPKVIEWLDGNKF